MSRVGRDFANYSCPEHFIKVSNNWKLNYSMMRMIISLHDHFRENQRWPPKMKVSLTAWRPSLVFSNVTMMLEISSDGAMLCYFLTIT